MSIEKVLYTAYAKATGGRDGRAVSWDGILDVKLVKPRELGGSGGPGTNPEQLFAAGYAACFIGAMKFVAWVIESTLRLFDFSAIYLTGAKLRSAPSSESSPVVRHGEFSNTPHRTRPTGSSAPDVSVGLAGTSRSKVISEGAPKRLGGPQ